ncbi:MAG: phosphodiester glycosidase family protein [Candidatus Woesearchaeota archaeon]
MKKQPTLKIIILVFLFIVLLYAPLISRGESNSGGCSNQYSCVSLVNENIREYENLLNNDAGLARKYPEAYEAYLTKVGGTIKNINAFKEYCSAKGIYYTHIEGSVIEYDNQNKLFKTKSSPPIIFTLDDLKEIGAVSFSVNLQGSLIITLKNLPQKISISQGYFKDKLLTGEFSISYGDVEYYVIGKMSSEGGKIYIKQGRITVKYGNEKEIIITHNSQSGPLKISDNKCNNRNEKCIALYKLDGDQVISASGSGINITINKWKNNNIIIDVNPKSEEEEEIIVNVTGGAEFRFGNKIKVKNIKNNKFIKEVLADFMLISNNHLKKRIHFQAKYSQNRWTVGACEQQSDKINCKIDIHGLLFLGGKTEESKNEFIVDSKEITIYKDKFHTIVVKTNKKNKNIIILTFKKEMINVAINCKEYNKKTDPNNLLTIVNGPMFHRDGSMSEAVAIKQNGELKQYGKVCRWNTGVMIIKDDGSIEIKKINPPENGGGDLIGLIDHPENVNYAATGILLVKESSIKNEDTNWNVADDRISRNNYRFRKGRPRTIVGIDNQGNFVMVVVENLEFDQARAFASNTLGLNYAIMFDGGSASAIIDQGAGNLYGQRAPLNSQIQVSAKQPTPTETRPAGGTGH